MALEKITSVFVNTSKKNPSYKYLTIKPRETLTLAAGAVYQIHFGTGTNRAGEEIQTATLFAATPETGGAAPSNGAAAPASTETSAEKPSGASWL